MARLFRFLPVPIPVSRPTFPSPDRFANLVASWILLAGVLGVYGVVPHFQDYFSARVQVGGLDVTWWRVVLVTGLFYGLCLPLVYLLEVRPRVSKSRHCLAALGRYVAAPLATWRGGLTPDQRLGLLSVLLKAFFAPLMVAWLFDHTVQMVAHGGQLLADLRSPSLEALAVFNAHGFWFLFKLILFLDVLFFTLGYLVELPVLKNEIRSVDPTLLGWGVALACYPPFNTLTGQVFGGGYSAEFPQFSHPGVHLAANAFLLVLMGIYTWASVALNFKASNLTHRGIVDRGPYRLVRHPAYVCKNLAWWIGLLPALLTALDTSLNATLLTLGSMLGWSVIYYMRAVTEEDHLRGVDGEYDAYSARVPYRFVPGLV